jgi:hypothetical protein
LSLSPRRQKLQVPKWARMAALAQLALLIMSNPDWLRSDSPV